MSADSHHEADVFRLAGSTLDGRFVVDRAIAEGGFGLVYRARQVALDRPVAVKVLKTPPDLGERAREQFLEVFAGEARTIARITHPNIVQVYDFGVSTMPSGERAAWMALEWLSGITLEDELFPRRGQGGRTPAECMTLMRPILAALAVVHAAGVAHRDLKPANIMRVASPEGRGTTPKLLDFGIAKVMGEDEVATTSQTATRSRNIAFSPWYASPEQVSHARSGPWTDVHALGLILTEMLTDRAPFTGATSTALFQQILDASTRPTPGRFGVDVGAWEPVLARATSATPTDRYKNAGELLAALESTVDAAIHVGRPGAATSTGAVTTSDTVYGPTAPTDGARIAPARTPLASAGRTASDAKTRVFTRSRYGLPVALAAGVALILLAGGYRLASSVDAAPPASTTPQGLVGFTPPPPSTGSAEAPTIPEPAIAPAASPSHPAGQGRPVAPAVRPAGSHTSTGPPAVPTATRAVNCDPPFTVDAQGAKHYKPECDN